MKKLTLILLTMFGLVLFNSCKDDTDDNPQPAATNILNELKGYTGKTVEQITETMQSKGFTLRNSESDIGMTNYSFINADSTSGYEFMEYESKICIVSFNAYNNNNRDLLLSTFETNSKSAISFVSNTTFEYNSEIELSNSTEDSEQYPDRNSFLNAYNQNKNSIIYCYENWMTADYIIGNEFNYEEDENEYYSLIGYGDLNLLPPFVSTKKSNNKSIFEMFHK